MESILILLGVYQDAWGSVTYSIVVTSVIMTIIMITIAMIISIWTARSWSSVSVVIIIII